jgi:hypothetical protein
VLRPQTPNMAKQNAILLLVILFVGGQFTTGSSRAALTIPHTLCVVADVALNITACAPIIKTSNISAGSVPKCCGELGVIKLMGAILGNQTTSTCVQAALSASVSSTSILERPSQADVDVDISAQLQDTCSVNLGFSIDVDA